MNYRYDGQVDPRIHIETCVKAWKHRSANEWVHLFAHILDTRPRNWYNETKLRIGTKNWSLLTDGFKLTFEFESEYPKIDDALGMIKIKVFEDDPFPLDNQPDWCQEGGKWQGFQLSLINGPQYLTLLRLRQKRNMG